MTVAGWITIFGFAVIVTALALPLGRYMAAVYTGGRTWFDPVLGPVERLVYRGIRTDPHAGQDWKAYAKSLLWFSLVGWLLLYLILRTQTFWDFTGLNPLHYHSPPWNVTFNTTSRLGTSALTGPRAATGVDRGHVATEGKGDRRQDDDEPEDGEPAGEGHGRLELLPAQQRVQEIQAHKCRGDQSEYVGRAHRAPSPSRLG